MISIHEDKTTNFNNNGLAVLEPESCIFSPVINDVWQVDITLPLDSEKKYLFVENERILKITGIDCIREQTSEYQLYRIVNHKKDLKHMYIVAWPIGLDARLDTYTNRIQIFDKTATDALAMINAMSNKYTVSGSGYDATKHSTEYEKTNMIAVLNGADSSVQNASGESNYQNFVKTWDGEICYDNYNIKVNHRLGDDTDPYDVRYGKNITGMSYTLDNTNIITRLYPYAKSGEALNAISDYTLSENPTPYVDAENFDDYPIPHIYYAETPYNLVQLTNDGSKEYAASIELYNGIKMLTAAWLNAALLNDSVYDGLLNEIELDWINNNYAVTNINDGVVGIVEHIARKIWYNQYHNILSGSVQSLIYNAIKAGCDETLKNTSSQFYIGSAAKSLKNNTASELTYFYTYDWDTAGTYRVRAEENDVIWVYASSKWYQIAEDGFSTGVTDKGKWKWFKKKVGGVTIKRYGNKKKGYYLHSQWWKINDVWYWFNANGEGKKGQWLNNTYNEYFDEAEIDYSGSDHTIYDMLLPVCISGEADLFELLYRQMVIYCYTLYETDKLSFPTLKLDINMVDISKTTEYANYSFLEKIHLGDTVKIFNPIISSQPSTARIIGLKYDVLRGFNTEIQIGITETSVINLLNSIGSSNNDTRIVFGDSFEEVNGKIEVKPPATPYIEDVIVNGASVVRNHKAYLDLDEMGIDETIDVLYGEEAPDDETDGEDKDFYLKLGIETANILTLDKFHNENSTEQNPIYLTDFTATSRDEYSFVIHGCPDNNGHGEWCYFELDGLIEGNTYELSFKMQFNSGATFPWPYNDYIETCGERINFQKDSALHTYSCTFTYEAGGQMLFSFPAINDNVMFTATITEMKIVGDFVASQIDEIYSKYEDKWRKYTPPIMIGATSESDGQSGAVPQPTIADKDKFFKGDGTWAEAQGASAVSDLTDVELTDLADGEILKYDATAQKWLNAVESGGGGGNALILDAQIYSTDEKQVGVWIDGKPLYQKTFSASINISSGSYQIITISDYISNIDLITDSEAFIVVSGQTTYLPYILGSNLSQYTTGYALGGGVIYISRGNGGAIQGDSYITLLYTKTTDTAGSGGYQAYGFSPIIYSEEEREVGVWIDNKPLYCKTWKLSSEVLISSGGININQIDTSGMESLVQGCASYSIASNAKTIPLDIWKYSNTTYYASNIQAYIDIVTLYYTKTTDVAGSGSYNTLGVPTVHYTEDEQVIGTWIDGKPLYQKTVWHTTNIVNKAWNDVYIADNISKLIDIKGYWELNSDALVRLPIEYLNGNDRATYLYSKSDISSYNYVGVYPYFNGFDNRINGVMLTVQYTKTTD